MNLKKAIFISRVLHLCDFASKSHTPNADRRYGGLCAYHSLWQPDNKVFKVNKEWIPGEDAKPRRIF